LQFARTAASKLLKMKDNTATSS